MSARHSFRAQDGKPFVRVCSGCGMRRRVVFELTPQGHGDLRELRLFALPGKTEWTDTDRRCADVREGKTR